MKQILKRGVSQFYIMAQAYHDFVIHQVTNRIVAGPPYLESCKSQIQELLEHDAKIKAMEAEIENIKMDIAVERERMRKKQLFEAFEKDIRRMDKEDRINKKNLVVRKGFQAGFFKPKTDVISGGGSGSVWKK